MREQRTPSMALGRYEKVRTSEEQGEDGRPDDDHLSASNWRRAGQTLRVNTPYSTRDQALDESVGNGSNHTTSARSPLWSSALTPRHKGRLRVGTPSPIRASDMEDESATGLLNDERNAAQVSGAAISPTAARAGKDTIGWMVWPLPSFTHHFFGVRYPDEPCRPTDYLDGMRGVASLFVFFGHYLLGVHDNFVHEGYAFKDNWNVFQFPFIRTLYAGSAMVSIFFVISGYVLSQRCVIAMRNRQPDKLYPALTSMTFRRGVRLFLPSLVIMLVCLSFVLLGILGPKFPEEWNWGVEFETFRHHLFGDLLNLWYWDIWIDNWYAPQLWTIPVEYRCSMLLFVLILMLARAKPFVRGVVESVTMVYLFYATRWDAALFVSGLILAELRLAVDARQERRRKTYEGAYESDQGFDWPAKHERWYYLPVHHIPLWIIFIGGFYLTGFPDAEAAHTPGYDFFTQIWHGDNENEFRFWLAQSAILVVGSTTFLPMARAFFSTRIARYLGKISYALYLVHQLMNRTIRVMIWSMFWRVLDYEEEDGDRKGLRFEGGWLLGGLLYIPLVIWAADVFWRAVDVPTVKFAKWLEGKCSFPDRR